MRMSLVFELRKRILFTIQIDRIVQCPNQYDSYEGIIPPFTISSRFQTG